jgi:hypothetical protein
MLTKKYVRIQGRELSYVTGRPKGIFAMNWRMIYDGVYNDEEARLFKSIDDWFNENLIEPEQCKNGNPMKVITYFKTETAGHMLDKLLPVCALLDKYTHPYDIVYTDYVGKILYEDEYQVAVVEG